MSRKNYFSHTVSRFNTVVRDLLSLMGTEPIVENMKEEAINPFESYLHVLGSNEAVESFSRLVPDVHISQAVFQKGILKLLCSFVILQAFNPL
jgi:hypothetical protein